ncbi:helix-turn-helix domain-containing protein [Megasphaera elsdenii]|uniref:helix-turn-helix domain-containing protein n=1 Tax=Megasphaera elsdenii TaxID=907 RepID=UPI004035430C
MILLTHTMQGQKAPYPGDEERKKRKFAAQKAKAEESGRRLKILRTALQMTQREFASFLGFPQSTISSCERGTRRIPIGMLTILSQKGYDANWLALGRDVDQSPYHLQREADILAIEDQLKRLSDDAVHLTRNWVDLLVTFQDRQGLLLPPPKKQTKQRRNKNHDNP